MTEGAMSVDKVDWERLEAVSKQARCSHDWKVIFIGENDYREYACTHCGIDPDDCRRVDRELALAFPAIKAERGELTDLLENVERKLSSYVGVCSGDKELTHTLLPAVRASLGKGRPRHCRMAQKERGEAYPRSGCHACSDGGLRGCPYARPTQEQTNDR